VAACNEPHPPPIGQDSFDHSNKFYVHVNVCWCKHKYIGKLPFLAHDSIICYSALYAIARPSVHHTGGSVKNC